MYCNMSTNKNYKTWRRIKMENKKELLERMENMKESKEEQACNCADGSECCNDDCAHCSKMDSDEDLEVEDTKEVSTILALSNALGRFMQQSPTNAPRCFRLKERLEESGLSKFISAPTDGQLSAAIYSEQIFVGKRSLLFRTINRIAFAIDTVLDELSISLSEFAPEHAPSVNLEEFIKGIYSEMATYSDTLRINFADIIFDSEEVSNMNFEYIDLAMKAAVEKVLSENENISIVGRDFNEVQLELSELGRLRQFLAGINLELGDSLKEQTKMLQENVKSFLTNQQFSLIFRVNDLKQYLGDMAPVDQNELIKFINLTDEVIDLVISLTGLDVQEIRSGFLTNSEDAEIE